MDSLKYNNALPLNTRLKNGKYVIDKVLGIGGFGITYRVQMYDGNIRQRVAIKEFFMSSLCERQGLNVMYSAPVKNEVEAGLKEFISEAKRLDKEKIHHPNIVGINEVFKENGTAYYVMEYIRGDDLRKYMSVRDMLPEENAKTVLLPLLQAISHLHSHRITHLDIKPDNIIMSLDEDTGRVRPVLIDFGLSKHYEANGNQTSKARFAACSPGYSPLEQYHEGGMSEFTPQADIYSLAATLFFMLSNKDPMTAYEVSDKKICELLPEGVSEKTKEAIVNAMKPNKTERIQTVEEFATALGLKLSNAEESHYTVPIEMLVKGRKGGYAKKIFIVAVIVSLLVVGIGGWFYLKKRPAEVFVQVPLLDETVTDTLVLPQSEPVQQQELRQLGLHQDIESEQHLELREAATDARKEVDAVNGQKTVANGTLTLKNAVWKGGIKNGKPDGRGTLTVTADYQIVGITVPAGNRIEAQYENGNFIIGEIYDSDGKKVRTIMP